MRRSFLSFVSVALATLAVLFSTSPSAVSAQGAPTLYSFCYTLSNTLQTSPYLPWSVSVSGQLLVNLTAGANSSFWVGATQGWPVIDARGVRTLVSGGVTTVNNIVGIAPTRTWGWNDNRIHITAPYLDSIHALTFTMQNNALFVDGYAVTNTTAGGNKYVNVHNYTAAPRNSQGAGILELDNPLSDGIVNLLTSTFYLSPTPYTGAITDAFTCPNAVPTTSVPSATAVANYTSTQTWAFCSAATFGASDYFDQITTDFIYATITTTGYPGVGAASGVASVDQYTPTGAAYVIKSLSGVRSLIAANDFQNSSSQIGTIQLAALSADSESFSGFYTDTSSFSYGNNVLYASYPHMDKYGWSLESSVGNLSIAFNGAQIATGTNYFLLRNSNQGVQETVFADLNGIVYFPLGYMTTIVTPMSALGSTSLATWAQQCLPTGGTGTILTYNFCYYLDDNANSGIRQGITYAHGVFQARATTRQGRSALQLIGINGVRTVTATQPSQFTISQSIVGLAYTSDGSWDNVVYVSPRSDTGAFVGSYGQGGGVAFELNGKAVFPGINPGFSTLIEFGYYNGLGYWDLSEGGPFNYTYPSTKAAFNFSLYNTSNPQPIGSCGALDTNVVVPVVTVYSFAWYHIGSDSSFFVSDLGTVSTYNVPIAAPDNSGRSGYPIATIGGYRIYSNVNGLQSTSLITGLANNYYPRAEGWVAGFLGTYDNLLYTDGQAYIDNQGWMLQFSNNAATGGGVEAGFPVARLFNDTSSSQYGYTEAAITAITPTYSGPNTTVTFYYTELIRGKMNVVADNGAAYQQNTIGSTVGLPRYQTYNFCYSMVNTLATSPYMGWSVYVTGTLNVTQRYQQIYVSNQAYGFRVVGATGTRTVVYQGKTTTQNIVGVAAPGSYNFNDNIVNLAAPYFDNTVHAITFILDGPALYADGYGNGNFVNLGNYTVRTTGAGISELDQVPNDGTASTITSQFDLKWASPSSAFNYTCPFTAPTVATPSATAVAQFSQTAQYSFCWSHTGGPGGYGTIDGGNWTIASSGVITVRAYQGTCTDGRACYAITNVTGVRTYSMEGKQVQSVNLIGVGTPVAGANGSLTRGAYFIGSSEQALQANNVLYPSYPYFDTFGVNIVGGATFDEEEPNGDSGTNVVRVWNNGGATGDFQEYLLDFITGYIYYNHAGISVVQPYTGASAASFGKQCSYSYGSFNTYSFCYFLDDSNYLGYTVGGVVSAVGTFTAYGPQTRYGRTNALQVTSINGVRTMTRLRSAGNTVVNQNIVALKYQNQDLVNGGSINDNLVFPTAPYVTQSGLLFSVSGNAVYPGFTGATPDINLWLYSGSGTSSSPYTYIEYDGNRNGADYSYPNSNFLFNYQLYNASNPVLSTCQSADATYVPTVPSLVTYSFCFYHLGSTGTFAVTVAGQLSAYSTPVQSPYGRTDSAYPVSTMSGVRQYADNTGGLSTNAITGLSSNWIGAAEGFGQSPSLTVNPLFNVADQLIYPTTAPYLDEAGLMYTFSGSAYTANAPVYDASVARLLYDSSSNAFGYVDETLYNITVNGSIVTYYSESLIHGSFKVVQDNGASALSGSISSQCGVPATQTFQFCYQITNTLATSPYLQWSVYVTGTMTVNTTYGVGEYKNVYGTGFNTAGYPVVAASGTRIIQYAGKTATTNFVLAPQNAYQYNDNVLNLGTPALDNNFHSISFMSTNGPVPFATGPLGSNIYFNIQNFTQPYASGAGFTESDLPLNDGVTNVVTSQWNMRFLGSAGSTSCPFTQTMVSPASSALTSYGASQQFSFCYSVTGGPGSYGTQDGGAWTALTSGVFTTTSYGTCTDGRQCFLITGVSGTRTYIYENGTLQTLTITGVGSINAALNSSLAGNTIWGSLEQGFQSNNVYYPSWPYLDTMGVSLLLSGNVDNVQVNLSTGGEVVGVTTTNVVHAFNAYGGDFQEWVNDPVSGYVYFQHSGSLVSSAYSSSVSVASYGQQCLYNAGTPTTFSFCYYIDQTASTTNPFLTYAYGTMTANGPVSRQGRTAYSVQAMNGVRAYQAGATSSATTTYQNIKNIEYINEDLEYGTINTNLIYTTAPTIDYIGLTFTLISGPVGARGTATDPDINLWIDTVDTPMSLWEWNGNYTDAVAEYTSSTTYGFTFAPYSGTGALTSCGSSKVPAIQLTTYSFCYGLSGGSNGNFTGTFNLGVSGTFTTYNTPVTYNGRTGYPLHSITGTRQYQDSMGRSGTATITGLSSDWIAEQQGWTFDQLYYTSEPHFDRSGVLYKFSGNAQTTQTGTQRDNVIKMFSPASSGNSFAEEIYLSNGAQISDIQYTGVTFVVAADGGASANSILGQCGVSFSSGGGGGSSSLSGGAIAGIVVGSVVGAALLCVVCVLLFTFSRGAKSDKGASAEPRPTGSYQSEQSGMQNDTEHSRVEQSQVELQNRAGAEGEAEETA